MHKFGGVENDHIELPPRVAVFAQHSKGIAEEVFVLRPFAHGREHIMLGHRQCFGRNIHIDDAFGPRHRPINGEATCVGEHIEHFFARHNVGLPQNGAVFALVEIKARLLAIKQVNTEGKAVFVDGDKFGGGFTSQDCGHIL